MSDHYYQIVLTAAELKRAAHDRYDEFVKSIQGFAESAKNDLVASSKDTVFQAQGRAQVLAELVKKLGDCLALDEQYRKRK